VSAGVERREGAATALIFMSAAGVTLFADLLTKHLAFKYLDPAAVLPIIPGCLNLRVSVNRGAVFGIGQGMGLFFVLFTVVAAAGIIWAACAYGRSSRFLTIGLGLLLGGALGNLWDRLVHGCVRDFIDAYVGRYHWPTFNIGDAAICAGAAIIVLHAFLSPRERPEKKVPHRE